MNTEGDWIQGEDSISKIACDHFEEIFTCNKEMINVDILDFIPIIITHDQNETLLLWKSSKVLVFQ